MTKFASRKDTPPVVDHDAAGPARYGMGVADFSDMLEQDVGQSLEEGLAAEPMATAPGYEPLFGVLADAYAQSAFGKGKERHGGGKPFDRQPIMEIGRMLGPDGQLFQVIKKAQEAGSMARRGEPGRAEHELLGVIVYAAAAVLLLREQKAR